MRRMLIGGAALALATVVCGSSAARAADAVSGEVVDMACYLHDPVMHGPAHRKCAETCAKKGIPMGLLTDDGKVFLLLEDHDNPKAYGDALAKAAQTISVEGKKVAEGGVNGIIVESVK